jgi:hypothetical protein
MRKEKKASEPKEGKKASEPKAVMATELQAMTEAAKTEDKAV